MMRPHKHPFCPLNLDTRKPPSALERACANGWGWRDRLQTN